MGATYERPDAVADEEQGQETAAGEARPVRPAPEEADAAPDKEQGTATDTESETEPISQQPEPEPEVRLDEVTPMLQPEPVVDTPSEERVVKLKRGDNGFGFRVLEDLRVDAITDPSGPAARAEPPFPLGWHLKKCNGSALSTKRDLEAALAGVVVEDDVEFTLQPPSEPSESAVLDAPLATDETADEILEAQCSCLPKWLRDCISAVCTSCIWMVIRTLWDVVPWLLPFGLFMRSLSLQPDSGIQVIVLLFFVITPIISMRYHGNSDEHRHALGDGWNILFVGYGSANPLANASLLTSVCAGQARRATHDLVRPSFPVHPVRRLRFRPWPQPGRIEYLSIRCRQF